MLQVDQQLKGRSARRGPDGLSLDGRRRLPTAGLAAAVTVLALCPLADAKEDAVALESLSGSWKGQTQTSQVGSCAYVGSTGVRSSSAMGGRVRVEPSRLNLTFDTSEKLRIEQLGESGPYSSVQWEGKVDAEHSVYTTRQLTTNCSGHDVISKSEFKGKLRIRRGVPVIALKGIEEWCPSSHCKFQLFVKMHREDTVGADDE